MDSTLPWIGFVFAVAFAVALPLVILSALGVAGGWNLLAMRFPDVDSGDDSTRAFERVMLGLRLDEGLSLGGLESALDPDALERMIARGMVERTATGIRLASHARLIGGAVTAELLL